ncbi:MAG TPA: hypothetical protein VJI69_03550, partial [Bacteroidia bacterium]|nr:hypothetical protein [Bacteroidia bacterium]
MNYIKKYFFLFVFQIIFFISVSQPSKIDSLKQFISTAKEDTNKVNALNALSWKLIITGEYNQAMEKVKTSLSLADTIKYKKGKAVALNNIGVIFWNQGNYPEALNNYFSSLKIREEIGD